MNVPGPSRQEQSVVGRARTTCFDFARPHVPTPPVRCQPEKQKTRKECPLMSSATENLRFAFVASALRQENLHRERVKPPFLGERGELRPRPLPATGGKDEVKTQPWCKDSDAGPIATMLERSTMRVMVQRRRGTLLVALAATLLLSTSVCWRCFDQMTPQRPQPELYGTRKLSSVDSVDWQDCELSPASYSETPIRPVLLASYPGSGSQVRLEA